MEESRLVRNAEKRSVCACVSVCGGGGGGDDGDVSDRARSHPEGEAIAIDGGASLRIRLGESEISYDE